MTSEQQRKLGAYYTPEQVTDSLSSWAIRSADDVVLEPSFGGCNFLTSSVKVLCELGARNPYDHIFGFDIDSSAFEILKQKNLDSPNFVYEDFLESSNEETIRANVILGNPPYLPVHKLEEIYKQKIFKIFKKSTFKIPKRSSLWVYFIVHSFKYLNQGGRMAWVVPDSIAFTDYGKVFLNQLAAYFTSIKIIRIEERYFADAGTKEKTSFLLCDGYLNGSSVPEEQNFKFLYDALEAMSDEANITGIYEALPTQAESIQLVENYKLTTLGDLFNIRIGIVIGATNLLVFNQHDAEKSPFHPNYTYPVITKGKQLNGLSISRDKLLSTGNNMPLYLIDGIKLQEDDAELFNDLLHKIPQSVLLNQTFRNRSKLFGYDDYNHPDAFLTFYSQGNPKFIINSDKELNCTNSVHRLYLKEEVDLSILKFTALQFFSGFFEADIHALARQYGNSIHKFEPSDAKKIPVIIPFKIDSTFKKNVEKCLKVVEKNIELGNIIYAKKLALNFITQLTC